MTEEEQKKQGVQSPQREKQEKELESELRKEGELHDQEKEDQIRIEGQDFVSKREKEMKGASAQSESPAWSGQKKAEDKPATHHGFDYSEMSQVGYENLKLESTKNTKETLEKENLCFGDNTCKQANVDKLVSGMGEEPLKENQGQAGTDYTGSEKNRKMTGETSRKGVGSENK